MQNLSEDIINLIINYCPKLKCKVCQKRLKVSNLDDFIIYSKTYSLPSKYNKFIYCSKECYMYI
jgi:hypothetical protein